MKVTINHSNYLGLKIDNENVYRNNCNFCSKVTNNKDIFTKCARNANTSGVTFRGRPWNLSCSNSPYARQAINTHEF
ncbi:MAG: hypothetical protein PHV68_05370, partial [Candidatus Gastranaerophilales bacterium]|nr:hypothetical protein [Candidatus Gastranaerophilales bacterium]